MPRIAAETVAAHVAQQEAAVVEAAARLVAERGVRDVSLADIAAEVGLARNSLYRYFPDKDHILAAWFRRDLAPVAADAAAALRGGGTATDRLLAWLDVQLDALCAPEHRVLLVAVADSPTLSDDVREQIAAGHRELYAGVVPVVAEALEDHRPRGHRHRDGHTVTMLLVGLLRSAAELVEGGGDRAAVRRELHRCVTGALADG